jgi:hypothetical protein
LLPLSCSRSAAVTAVLLAPLDSFAHGIGERYDLPVPLPVWLTGAAIAVLASFVVAAVAVRRTPSFEHEQPGRPTYHACRPLDRLRQIAQVCGVGALILVVTGAFYGEQTPTRNLAPVMVWVIWWIGLAYVSALFVNVWPAVNPWAAVFAALETALRPLGLLPDPRSYPAWLGSWPAVMLFGAFAWIELVYDARAIPRQLGILILTYSLITWIGMLLYGREAWLTKADPFTVAFRTLAKFAPLEIDCQASPRMRNRDGDFVASNSGLTWKLRFRPYGSGLVASDAVSPSMLVFVSLLLSTVTFDGFLATPVWNAIEKLLFNELTIFDSSWRLTAINSLGLVLFVLGFLSLYLLTARWMATRSQGELSPASAARLFVVTLIPIAIGYHLAHYLSYFLQQGQLVIRLVSDPFALGWDLFGTARYRPNFDVVGARFIWYVSVIAIVTGHIFAVYCAHRIALRKIPNRQTVLASQLPMLVLMIAYTVISLWIIAQPVTTSG